MGAGAPDRARIAAALTQLSSDTELLRDWDLRPERMLSLLAALAAFLDLGSDEEAFGDLSLRGLEHLCETWARLLDPYWSAVKHEVRSKLSAGRPVSHVAIAAVLDGLRTDLLAAAEIKAIMTATLDAARTIPQAPASVAGRVSVAFVALGAPIN